MLDAKKGLNHEGSEQYFLLNKKVSSSLSISLPFSLGKGGNQAISKSSVSFFESRKKSLFLFDKSEHKLGFFDVASFFFRFRFTSIAAKLLRIAQWSVEIETTNKSLHPSVHDEMKISHRRGGKRSSMSNFLRS
jgi:hypothetical protein